MDDSRVVGAEVAVVLTAAQNVLCRDTDFIIDNLLARIQSIIVMIRWTGLAPWSFEFPFPSSLLSTFLGGLVGQYGNKMLDNINLGRYSVIHLQFFKVKSGISATNSFRQKSGYLTGVSLTFLWGNN